MSKVNLHEKVPRSETRLVDQKTKKIIQYDFKTKIMSLSYMIVNGRHPENNKAILEKDCSFVMYVIKGKGTYVINGEQLTVEEGDAVFVRAGSTFIADGNFEYLTVVVPAFHQDSIEEIEQ